MSASSFIGYLKGKSALMIFDRHANLKYKFGNRHFWSEGYYVSTVGLNDATIKKYIQDQEKYDIMQDKLSVKEYENPCVACNIRYSSLDIGQLRHLNKAVVCHKSSPFCVVKVLISFLKYSKCNFDILIILISLSSANQFCNI